MDEDIKLFTLEDCPRCESLERWLKENNIDHAHTDVTNNDPLISQLIEATRQMEMPIIFIREHVLCGHEASINNVSKLVK